APPHGARRIYLMLLHIRCPRGQKHASARETALLRSNFDLGIAVDTWMSCDVARLESLPRECGSGGASARHRKANGATINGGADAMFPHMMVAMAEPSTVSPFSRPPAPWKTFSRPAPAVRTVAAGTRAGSVEGAENLPLGFMAGLVAAFSGAGLWALITIFTGFQIGWMAVGGGL